MRRCAEHNCTSQIIPLLLHLACYLHPSDRMARSPEGSLMWSLKKDSHSFHDCPLLVISAQEAAGGSDLLSSAVRGHSDSPNLAIFKCQNVIKLHLVLMVLEPCSIPCRSGGNAVSPILCHNFSPGPWGPTSYIKVCHKALVDLQCSFSLCLH